MFVAPTPVAKASRSSPARHLRADRGEGCTADRLGPPCRNAGRRLSLFRASSSAASYRARASARRTRVSSTNRSNHHVSRASSLDLDAEEKAAVLPESGRARRGSGCALACATRSHGDRAWTEYAQMESPARTMTRVETQRFRRTSLSRWVQKGVQHRPLRAQLVNKGPCCAGPFQ